MVLIDLTLEYFLIIKLYIISFFYRNPPEKWNEGKLGTVVLVPGLLETFHFLDGLGDFLNSAGYRIVALPELNSTASIKTQAELIAKNVNSLTPQSENIILLCHSKGGVVSKYILDNFPKTAKNINGAITVAVPFGGSILGHLKIFNIQELQPLSDLIKKFIPEKTPSKIYNFYSKLDNHVIPNTNLILNGANNKMINITGHTRILFCSELKTEILKVLKQF